MRHRRSTAWSAKLHKEPGKPVSRDIREVDSVFEEEREGRRQVLELPGRLPLGPEGLLDQRTEGKEQLACICCGCTVWALTLGRRRKARSEGTLG